MLSRPIAAAKPPAAPRPAKRKPIASGPGPAAKPDDVWRIFQVNVPAHEEPIGKDDYSVNPQLLQALAKKVGCKNPTKLDAEQVQIVRKSFDSRYKNRSVCGGGDKSVPQNKHPNFSFSVQPHTNPKP